MKRPDPANWVRVHRIFPSYLGWRPYFACGRRQLRVGIKRYKYIDIVLVDGSGERFVRPYIRYLALEWQ